MELKNILFITMALDDMQFAEKVNKLISILLKNWLVCQKNIVRNGRLW